MDVHLFTTTFTPSTIPLHIPEIHTILGHNSIQSKLTFESHPPQNLFGAQPQLHRRGLNIIVDTDGLASLDLVIPCLEETLQFFPHFSLLCLPLGILCLIVGDLILDNFLTKAKSIVEVLNIGSHREHCIDERFIVQNLPDWVN